MDTRTRILAVTCDLMEARRGQVVSMSDIAGAAGLSRQAVYLHFGSRAELLIAAVRYMDTVHCVEDRVRALRDASTGPAMLDALVEFWGDYIPEIYGLAGALLAVRETDDAAAAAWDDRMAVMRESCRCIVESLQREGALAPQWERAQAIDLMRSLLSIRVWDALVMESGWAPGDYVRALKATLRRTFVAEA